MWRVHSRFRALTMIASCPQSIRRQHFQELEHYLQTFARWRIADALLTGLVSVVLRSNLSHTRTATLAHDSHHLSAVAAWSIHPSDLNRCSQATHKVWAAVGAAQSGSTSTILCLARRSSSSGKCVQHSIIQWPGNGVHATLRDRTSVHAEQRHSKVACSY